ncbi:MAG: hypothetical protein AABY15_02955 [Nanoarchaeota archaeon]
MDEEKKRRIKLVDAINHSKRLFRWSYKPIGDSQLQHDWIQTLLTKINEANKDFEGTIIMASNEINAILGDIEFFEFAQSSESQIVTSVYKTGVLAEKFTVYADAYLPATHLLIAKDDFFTSDSPECAVIYVSDLPIF